MSDKQKKLDSKSVFREWLEQLQQESWQLELLISGFALFGIWESRSILIDIDNYMIINSYGEVAKILKLLMNILEFGWSIFFVNLLIHIIFRGLWIGAIGLRYVSGDIDFEKLNYSKIFEDYLKEKIGSFDDYIERLEKVSSVIFSYTFLLFFLFLSLIVIFAECIIFVQILEHFFPQDDNFGNAMIIGFTTLLIMVFLLIMLIDFLGLGAFKRVKDKWFSRVFFFLYRGFSIASLSFLYRPLLYNFIDDKYTKKLLLFSVPYMILLLLIPSFRITAHEYFPSFSSSVKYHEVIASHSLNWHYYEDEIYKRIRQDKDLSNRSVVRSQVHYASLPSYEIHSDDLKIFLKYRKNDDRILKLKYPEIKPLSSVGFTSTLFSSETSDYFELDSLEKLNAEELSYMYGLFREASYIDSLRYKYGHKDEYYLSMGADKKQELSDEINDYYKQKKREQVSIQLEDTKQQFASIFRVFIDQREVEFVDNSLFYEHENMGEKGIISYIPIDSLARGQHLLTVEKITYDRQRADNTEITTHQIPFRKMK